MNPPTLERANRARTHPRVVESTLKFVVPHHRMVESFFRPHLRVVEYRDSPPRRKAELLPDAPTAEWSKATIEVSGLS
jgi:hypothetical protein